MLALFGTLRQDSCDRGYILVEPGTRVCKKFARKEEKTTPPAKNRTAPQKNASNNHRSRKDVDFVHAFFSWLSSQSAPLFTSIIVHGKGRGPGLHD